MKTKLNERKDLLKQEKRFFRWRNRKKKSNPSFKNSIRKNRRSRNLFVTVENLSQTCHFVHSYLVPKLATCEIIECVRTVMYVSIIFPVLRKSYFLYGMEKYISFIQKSDKKMENSQDENIISSPALTITD